MIKESLSRNKRLILAIITLYVLAIPVGYVCYDLVAAQMMPLIQKFVGQIQDKSQLEMAENIFSNNYSVCAILMITGTFILPAIFIIFVNGFAIGFVAKFLEVKNHDLFFLVKGIAPHGIFELPAIFISAAIGMRIGLSYLTLDNRKRVENVNKAIKDAVLINFLVVLPLLIIAALIEVFITSALLGKAT